MDVIRANDTTLKTTWAMGVRNVGSSTISGTTETVSIVVGTTARDADTKNITFETSSIPNGSTVVKAVLTATATIKRTQGSATKGYKFDDAEVCSLDATKITSSTFEKDITEKFAAMNGSTFENISIVAKYRAKYMQFNGKYIIVRDSNGAFVSQSYQYTTSYGTLNSTQIATLTLTDLKLTIYYTGDSGGSGEVTPATKWQKCEVYVCVPVS